MMNIYFWRDLERDKLYVKDEAGNKFDVPWQVQQAYRQEYKSVLKMAGHYSEKALSLEDDVRRLESENKRLREEMEDSEAWYQVTSDLLNAVRDRERTLKAQNKKMRALIDAALTLYDKDKSLFMSNYLFWDTWVSKAKKLKDETT